MKAGYKQTEVGVIPEDWDVATIGEFNPFVTSGSRGWAEYYSNFGDPFIRITNMTRKQINLDQSSLRFVALPKDSAEGKRTKLQDDDILISITADIGICSFVDEALPKPAYINQHIALVRFESDEIHPKYVNYYLASDPVQRLFVAGSDTGAKAGMNLEGIRSIMFAKPGAVEQKAIAGALSDVDRLIAGLEALIAKKRSLKTATMQQLLTGKTRLPGFGEGVGMKQTELGEIPEDWDVVTVESVADVKTGPFGSSLHESDYVLEGTPIITVEHLGDLGITRQNLPLVSDFDLKRLSSYKLKVGDIAFSRVGSVDRNALVTENEDGWLFSGRLLRVRTNLASANPFFLSFQFKTDTFKNKVLEVAVGQTMASLNTQILKSIRFILPESLAEQEEISKVLIDFDESTIETIKQLSKVKGLKQGMMQELLTGRTRLI